MKKRWFEIILCILTVVCANSFADYTEPGVMTPKTVDLWQMDSIVRNATSSRVQGESGDNTLWYMLKDSTGADSPTLGTTVAGPSLAFGEAMSFEDNATCGDNDKPNIWAYTRTTDAWGDWPYFKLEMWVKYNDFTGLQFVAMTDSWRIWTQNNIIRFTSYFSDGSNNLLSLNMGTHVSEWLYVTVSFDENGEQYFSVKSLDETLDVSTSATLSGKQLKTTSGYIKLASESGVRRSFNGAIDCMHITRPDIVLDFETPATDTVVGTNGLWHFNEASNDITPDDNASDAFGRDMPLTLTTGASLVTASDYPAGNSDFATCLELDGMGAHAKTEVPFSTSTSVLNVEFWMKPNPGILPGAENQVTGPLWLFAADSTFKIFLQVSDTALNLQYYVDGVNYYIKLNIASDGNWHHYKTVFDNGAMELYQDGIMLGSNTAAVSSLPTPTGQLWIGADGGARRYFWGWLDEIRIYGDTEAVCGDMGYLDADINKDCYVDIEDLEVVVSQWLKCTEEGIVGCDSLN